MKIALEQNVADAILCKTMSKNKAKDRSFANQFLSCILPAPSTWFSGFCRFCHFVLLLLIPLFLGNSVTTLLYTSQQSLRPCPGVGHWTPHRPSLNLTLTYLIVIQLFDFCQKKRRRQRTTTEADKKRFYVTSLSKLRSRQRMPL